MSDRRNAYLILGIDHGATAGEAAQAFARAARRIRTQGGTPYSIEDLTWALHQVEHSETDPESSLDSFRVPADPSVYPIAALDELLPPAAPLGRLTAPVGGGHQQLEDQALLAELRSALESSTVAALQSAAVEPADPALIEQFLGQSEPAEKRPSSSDPRPGTSWNAGASAGNDHYAGGWLVIAGLVIALLVWGLGTIEPGGSETSGDTASAESSQQANTRPPPSVTEPSPAPPTPSGPQAWVSGGDCLTLGRAEQWEPERCGTHDGEVVTLRANARNGNGCPSHTDIWFQDEWGVYCVMVVADTTPEGGHWGIGPVGSGSCLEVDPQGNLLGKAACGGRSIPALHVASSADGCDVAWAVGDQYIYWESVDDTNNYLCVDGYDWDAAGLP